MLFNDDSIIVGLTGMSGAGKTTACGAFREKGFSVVDCDIVAREVVVKGRPALKELSEAFDGIIAEDGTLNRRKMGDIIFSDPEKRALFNKIIYPYILYKVIADISDYISDGKRLILVDAPTLFESGADKICDMVVSVVSDKEHCIERIMKRDGITLRQAAERLGSQFDKSFYTEKSDYYIDNIGTSEELAEKALDIAVRIGAVNDGKE